MMNKRAIMVLLGAALAIAGICAAAKPLLIKYHLQAYDRASSRFSRLYDTSSDASQLAARVASNRITRVRSC